MSVFGSSYAGVYDSLYAEKDYAAECDLLETVFQRYAPGPVHTVLDLGCGTGNHSIPLAERGYRVVGVDRSEGMLDLAREKAKRSTAQERLQFRQGDATQLDLGNTFDAVLMMFAVLGYQVENQAVLVSLQSVRRHLRPGGLFFFDVWYGPAVLTERPADRVKRLVSPGGEILRFASGELDVLRHACTVRYEMLRLEGDRVIEQTREAHQMRFFFPRELALFLDCADLDLVRLGAFPGVESAPSERTWNVAVVAQAR